MGVQVAVEVDADPERAMGPTASTLAEAPDPDGQAFIPLHGFTVKDLRRDQRFRVRLLLALRHAVSSADCPAKPDLTPAGRWPSCCTGKDCMAQQLARQPCRQPGLLCPCALTPGPVRPGCWAKHKSAMLQRSPVSIPGPHCCAAVQRQSLCLCCPVTCSSSLYTEIVWCL